MKKKRDVNEFTPVNDQVIVKIIKEANISQGGILLPDGGGFAEMGGDADFYKVEIIKYGEKSLETNPELENYKYGFVSVFSGHYLMTKKDSYKVVPAFMIIAVCNKDFSLDSIKPTANRILIEETPESENTESGIYVGDMADPRDKEYLEGNIVGLGDLVNFKDIKKDMVAIYDPFVGNSIPRLSTNKIYKTIHDHDITVVY